MARTIGEVENRLGHFRTMIVGDLNMNPFEKGVVGAAGLNATMVRRRALKESRTVQQRTYRYFFNPMWRLFGDGDDSAPGTYHYDSHAHVPYFWPDLSTDAFTTPVSILKQHAASLSSKAKYLMMSIPSTSTKIR